MYICLSIIAREKAASCLNAGLLTIPGKVCVGVSVCFCLRVFVCA